jgi:hypothetical protein
MLDIQANCTKCGYIEAEIVYGPGPESRGRSAELTEADRRRIYQEEKARLEARQYLEGKQKAQGCLVLLVLAFGFWLYARMPNKPAAPTKPAPTAAELAQQKIDQAKREEERKVQHEKSECESTASAFVQAEDFVSKRLKSPSTAKFPWFWNAQIIYLGNCRHEIHSYVDSQNSFGAMIRTRYIVILRYAGQDNWVLEDLKLINP